MKRFKNNARERGGKDYEGSRRLLSEAGVLHGETAGIAAAVVFYMAVTMLTNYAVNAVTGIAGASGSADILSAVSPKGMFIYRGFSLPGIYLPVFLIKAYLSFGYILRTRNSLRDFNTGQKGHAREATMEEIGRQYGAVPLLREEYSGRHGFIVRERYDKTDPFEGIAWIDRMIQNLIVLGLTRSGKGQVIILPMIDMFSRVIEDQEGRSGNKPSMIITDPKRELYGMCSETLRNRGYEVRKIDLLEPAVSDPYDPLSAITRLAQEGRYDECENAVIIFTEDIFPDDGRENENPFFEDMAKQFVSAAILAHTMDAVLTGRPEANSLYSIAVNMAVLKMHAYDPDTCAKDRKDELSRRQSFLDLFFILRDHDDRARQMYSVIYAQPPETKENIYATAMRALGAFSSPLIGRMTSSGEITGKMLGMGEAPMAVFVTAHESNWAYQSIFSSFFSQTVYDLSLEATKNGGMLERPVEFILDEFGNMPPIPRLSNLLTICLGKNIRFTFVVQSYAQLNRVYGKDTADIITDNCGTEIYLLSKNRETLEKFSESLGPTTVTDVTRSGKASSDDRSLSEAQAEKSLISPYELRELHEGECIILRSINRRDREGKDIVPYPIVNTGIHRMKMCHEYGLSEIFSPSERSEEVTDLTGRPETLDLEMLIEARIHRALSSPGERDVTRSTVLLNEAAERARESTSLLEKKLRRLRAESMMKRLCIDISLLREIKDISPDDPGGLIRKSFNLKEHDEEDLRSLVAEMDEILKESEVTSDD